MKGISSSEYDKTIEQFGLSRITPDLVERLTKLSSMKVPHRFLTRGVFFTHRDLNRILAAVEKKEPFYLYTGRGPSSESMHLGHIISFEFTKWLSGDFNVPVVIMITDDEKHFP